VSFKPPLKLPKLFIGPFVEGVLLLNLLLGQERGYDANIVLRALEPGRAKGNPTLSPTSSYSHKEIASFSDLKAFDHPLAFGNWPTWSFPWTIPP
jgi:hypothetical protein